MLAFSTVKCISAFYVYKSFKSEYLDVYGDGFGGSNDVFWNNESEQAPRMNS